MENEQLELPLGRYGSLGAIRLDEPFYVPEHDRKVPVGRMTANDVLFASVHQWSEGNGLIAQALSGLWEYSVLNDRRQNPTVSHWDDQALDFFVPVTTA